MTTVDVHEPGSSGVEAELCRLEATINKGDGEAIRARWESGRYLLPLRECKKQLPKGLRDRLTAKLKVRSWELTARMKFAEKYRTEDEVADCISKFKTWFAITHEALPDNSRRAPALGDDDDEDAGASDETLGRGSATITTLKRIFDFLESIDSEDLNPQELSLLANIAEQVERHLEAAPRRADNTTAPAPSVLEGAIS